MQSKLGFKRPQLVFETMALPTSWEPLANWFWQRTPPVCLWSSHINSSRWGLHLLLPLPQPGSCPLVACSPSSTLKGRALYKHWVGRVPHLQAWVVRMFIQGPAFKAYLAPGISLLLNVFSSAYHKRGVILAWPILPPKSCDHPLDAPCHDAPRQDKCCSPWQIGEPHLTWRWVSL